MKLLVINGPNMNMLGIREKEKYGTLSLDEICSKVKEYCKQLNIEVDFFQSNIEGEIISTIHSTFERYDGIIINPGGYTHYSIAILDALYAVKVPAIEVHLTNIFAREGFRQKSVTGAGCIGIISGFGYHVYNLAVLALSEYINDRR